MSSTQMIQPNPYNCRSIKKLSAGETYSGVINFIMVGIGCEFPNNTTGCITNGGGGVNLNNFTSEFNQNIIFCKFDKVTITAGKCWLGVE